MSLDVEDTEDYKKSSRRINLLGTLKHYYESDAKFDELELGDFTMRDILMFMGDNEYPKRQFVDNVEEIIAKIDKEITEIKLSQKAQRLNEIKDKNLKSLLIIPSWSKVVQKKTMGFYLNKPVIDISTDTVIMLNHKIEIVTDKMGQNFAIISGPGMLYTKFSLAEGSYITNVKPINLIVLPVEDSERLLSAPTIFESDLDATFNELISIIPFSLIEEPQSIQTFLRGVLARNVFHPYKEVFEMFSKALRDPDSYNPEDGYFILSAHQLYHNRLMITKEIKTRGDESYKIATPGVASIIPGQKLLDELLSRETQKEYLEEYVNIKKEYIATGERLLMDWLPH